MLLGSRGVERAQDEGVDVGHHGNSFFFFRSRESCRWQRGPFFRVLSFLFSAGDVLFSLPFFSSRRAEALDDVRSTLVKSSSCGKKKKKSAGMKEKVFFFLPSFVPLGTFLKE